MLTTLRKTLLDTSQKRYLLRDTFAGDAAAGTLNGTPASGGPGARTAGSALALSNSVAVLTASVNDLFSLSAVTRAAGVALGYQPTITDVTQTIEFGFDTNQSGAIAGSALRITGDTLKPYDGGAAGPTIYVPLDAAAYKFIQLLRAAGQHIFVWNGTNWLYLGAWGSDATATLYAGWNNTDALGTIDYIKVAQLRIPSPIVSDSFTRANGALGSTDGLGHAEANGGNGLAWQYDSGVWAVAGNVAVGTPTLGSELLTDGALENWSSTTDLTSWTEALGGTSSVNRESSVVHGGAFAARFDIDGSNGTALAYQDHGLPIGSWFVVDFWFRSSASGKTGRTGTTTLTGLARDPGTTWTNYKEIFRSPTGDTRVYLYRQSAASASIYFDDISVKALTLSSLFSSVAVSTPDVLAEVAVTLTAGTQAGLVLNLDSAATPANFVLAYHNGTNCLLEKCVAGVYTTVVNAAATYSAGAVLRVIKDGTAYRLYYNNALVGTGTISDAGIVSNARHGLFSTYSGNSFDNLTIWARGTGGEYSALDSF